MLRRISQKIYGISILFILFSILIYGSISLFINRQANVSIEEQKTLTAAGNFFSLQQMFFQLRAWERDLQLRSNPATENHFAQQMKLLKQRLEEMQNSTNTTKYKLHFVKIREELVDYESEFWAMSQLLARHRLLTTDIETTYQSIETAALGLGNQQILRVIFLLNHFQTGYFKDHFSTGYQAIRIVLRSLAETLRKHPLPDERMSGYINAYDASLMKYEKINRSIEGATHKLETSYQKTLQCFTEAAKKLQLASNESIVSSNRGREQMKQAVNIYFPLASCAIFVFLMLLANKVVSPINSLLMVINRIKAGDTGQRFLPQGGDDELSQLGLAFNGMLETIDDNQVRMLAYQNELTDKVHQLAATNEQLQQEIKERMVAFQEKAVLEDQLRQAQKLEAIGTLAGGIAHDFNNILAAILGYAEMLKRKLAENSKERAYLGEIVNATERATQLVQQILLFSRKHEEKRSRVRFDKVIKDAVSLFRPTVPEGIKMTEVIDPQCGPILADEVQMHQIVSNLCANACHAVDPKRGEIEIRLEQIELSADLRHRKLKAGEYAQLTIKDNGVGMPLDVKSRIFDPFFTTKKPGEGTGMGLAVVYGIIREHGGEIEVTSAPGEGTVFTVLLPLSKGEVAVTEDYAPRFLRGEEKILFIDDEPMLSRLGKISLETLGYQVTATTSPQDALELFRKNPDAFDLVISDQTMPVMTGAELAQELMAIRGDVPIIICTGFSETLDADQAKAIGINDFLFKPFTQDSLAKSIRRVWAIHTSTEAPAISC